MVPPPKKTGSSHLKHLLRKRLERWPEALFFRHASMSHDSVKTSLLNNDNNNNFNNFFNNELAFFQSFRHYSNSLNWSEANPLKWDNIIGCNDVQSKKRSHSFLCICQTCSIFTQNCTIMTFEFLDKKQEQPQFKNSFALPRCLTLTFSLF